MPELDLTHEIPAESTVPPVQVSAPFSLEERREEARGDLARGLLWLLTFAIGGVLAFVGFGRLDGTVITQSIFPSLVALAGTALGFYFGSQSGKNADSGASGSAVPPPVGERTNPLGPGAGVVQAGTGPAGVGGGSAGDAGAGQAGGGRRTTGEVASAQAGDGAKHQA